MKNEQGKTILIQPNKKPKPLQISVFNKLYN